MAWINGRTALLLICFVRFTSVAQADEPALDAEPIRYKSDGLVITGIVSKPPGAGPFPLIVVNHGGFEPATTMGEVCKNLTRLGCVAIASDYRGVGGSEGMRELAKGEVTDVLSAIDHAETLPFVDRKRVAMLGFSHGGCISLLAAAHDDRIKAVVDFVGPTDLAEAYRYWVRTADELPTSKLLAGLSSLVGGTPDEAPDEWRLRSPLFVADKIRCPVLMFYGGVDELVPVEQGEKMAAALKAAGNTHVTLVIEPDSGHELKKEAWVRTFA